MIVNRSDPIYEAEFSPPSTSAPSSSSSGRYLPILTLALHTQYSITLPFFLRIIQHVVLPAQYSTSYLSQFVIHSSLDAIDTKMWTHRL